MTKRKETATPRSRAKVNTTPVGLPRQLGCVVLFPERVWELASSGRGWVSRPADVRDHERRRELAASLGVAL